MLEFWRRELSDFSSTLRWPFASPVKGSSVSTGLGTVLVKPDSSLARDLRAYERQDSGRIFRFLLASLFAFLHRLSGEETVTVGVPVHDRRNSEERETIGLRMKLVPVSIRFGDGDRFSDVLRQLNVKFRDILKNLRVPMGALSELLPTEGMKGGDRLFHTYFNYREDVFDSIRFEGLSVKEYPVDVKGVKTDLSIVVERIPGHEKWVGEGVLFKYDRSRFSEEDIVGLAERWFSLMSLFLRSPDTPLGSLDILLPGEDKLLERFESPDNETAGPDSTLHGLFQVQALQTPKAPALIGKGLVMTYAQLDRCSERLAEALISKGVERDSAVAVRCERGPETVVAMMAVLKAGGAFVPIDPGDPPGRCQTLIMEAGARFVIVGKGHAREAFEGVTSVIVDISREEGMDDETSAAIHDRAPSDPASLAYVMFTSGSTGRPKGVMVEHRSIVNRILYMRRFLSFGSGDRTLFKTSPSFDVSLVEVFLPLLSGGAVVIPSDTEASDSAAVSEWVRKHGVTYIHFVPAMLRTYLDEGFRPGVDDGLRAVWCGGDVLSEALMRRFLSVSPARLINGYGPTEASVGVSAWECRYDHP
jgi:non-ribosomal peptide synthetase component F